MICLRNAGNKRADFLRDRIVIVGKLLELIHVRLALRGKIGDLILHRVVEFRNLRAVQILPSIGHGNPWYGVEFVNLRSGESGVVIGFLHERFIHVPIELLATHTKRLDPASGWWRSVLAATGQPAQFDRGR